LTQPVGGARGTLVFEDDVRFARGWRARLDATVAALEDRHGAGFVLALYTPWFSVLEAYRSGELYINYPYESYFGTQGMYYPAKVRQGFSKFLKLHGVVASKNLYDLLLREYLSQSSILLYATAPLLDSAHGEEQRHTRPLA
jgi:hypothetical protein